MDSLKYTAVFPPFLQPRYREAAVRGRQRLVRGSEGSARGRHGEYTYTCWKGRINTVTLARNDANTVTLARNDAYIQLHLLETTHKYSYTC